MDHPSKEIAANETSQCSELRNNACNNPRNPIEPENRRSVASSSSALCASSTSTDRPESSARTNLNTVKDYGSNRGENDAMLKSEDKYLSELSSREYLSRMYSSFQDAKNLSSNQNSVDFSNMVSNSSNFSKIFLGKSLEPMKKNAGPYENLGKSVESCTTNMARNEKAYDPLMNTKNPQENVTEGSRLPNCGTSLREWLESKGLSANKADRLRLFRQIVQLVDGAHDQGIGLLELRPSSFILSENGNVKYVGRILHNDNKSKRGLEKRISGRDDFCVKMQKVAGRDKLVRPQRMAQKPTSNVDEMEKDWYAFPEGFKTGDLLYFNVYCLGLMLFEFLCHFESMEAHSAAMVDSHQRILPPQFLSGSPKEAGFCFWLLHPDPSSRPTTREILQSELLYESESTILSNDEDSCADMIDDVESDLLLHFLVSLQQHKQNKALHLLENIELLDLDINVIESSHASRKYSNTKNTEVPDSSIPRTNVVRDKLLDNINQLESAYFFLRSHSQRNEMPEMDRPDKDILKKRESWSWAQTQQNSETKEEKSSDRVGKFFDGICKFALYNKFEVCGALGNGDILNSNNLICSLSFDRDEEYIAAAGACKKIKIFEIGSLLDDNVDFQYPVLELSNESKFSCICWNNYIRNYLVSTDYDGLVQTWDAVTGQGFARYKEHQKRAWSVDFSQVDPTKFASGGDDCSIRLWSTNEKNSVGVIWNPTNVCCVQFSSYSSHLLSYGSADYKIYCYDLRHTKIPWCTLAGHKNAVSYVRFLDSETIVSASTDNTLKLWDLKKTSLEGLSTNACGLTFSGHTNEKNFVGLATSEGYIACGSETNEVYAYYRSLPMPIVSHKFECIDPISGDETSSDGTRHFVSSVCWRKKSQMIVAANSSGSINILRMV